MELLFKLILLKKETPPKRKVGEEDGVMLDYDDRDMRLSSFFPLSI